MAKKGEGTFSEVLKAQCIKNSKYVAIKCMKNHFDSLEQVSCWHQCSLHLGSAACRGVSWHFLVSAGGLKSRLQGNIESLRGWAGGGAYCWTSSRLHLSARQLVHTVPSRQHTVPSRQHMACLMSACLMSQQ